MSNNYAYRYSTPTRPSGNLSPNPSTSPNRVGMQMLQRCSRRRASQQVGQVLGDFGKCETSDRPSFHDACFPKKPPPYGSRIPTRRRTIQEAMEIIPEEEQRSRYYGREHDRHNRVFPRAPNISTWDDSRRIGDQEGSFVPQVSSAAVAWLGLRNAKGKAPYPLGISRQERLTKRGNGSSRAL